MIGTVESILNEFPEVMWDRFTGTTDDELVVYGWIKRNDGRSDFLVLYIQGMQVVRWVTSSARYSEVFSKRIDHNECKRVEKHWPNTNCIKLKVEL